MKMQFRFSTLLPVVFSLTLLSCGGGSGGSNSVNSSSGGSANTAGQAQGVYEGTTSNGLTFNAMVLPSDVFYAVYGNLIGNVLYVCGMATGQGASNNGDYSATDNDFDYCGGQAAVLSGNVTATYSTGVSMNGSITENGNTESFNATVPPSSQFNFATAASVSAVSGSWDGTLTDGESATVNIDSLGNMTGTSSGGCFFSGTIKPDSSNKNFFDISVTLGSSPCATPNQSASGIGVDYHLSDGVTTQLIAGVSSGSFFGIVFAAQR